MAQVESDGARFDATLNMSRIVVGAVTAGPLVFLGIAVALKPTAKPDWFLTYFAMGMAAAGLVASEVAMRSFVARSRAQIARGKWLPPRSGVPLELSDDASKLLLVFQTTRIMGAAIREGAAIFCLIAYMIEGSLVALGLGLGMLGTVAILFPTREGLRRWLDEQLTAVNEMRRLGE
jgi:hypothetical protein